MIVTYDFDKVNYFRIVYLVKLRFSDYSQMLEL